MGGDLLSLLRRRSLLGQNVDIGDQIVDLRLAEGIAEGRHVPFSLVNLSEDLGIGEFLSFGSAEVFRAHRFANGRISASVGPMALGAIHFKQFLSVFGLARLGCSGAGHRD